VGIPALSCADKQDIVARVLDHVATVLKSSLKVLPAQAAWVKYDTAFSAGMISCWVSLGFENREAVAVNRRDGGYFQSAGKLDPEELLRRACAEIRWWRPLPASYRTNGGVEDVADSVQPMEKLFVRASGRSPHIVEVVFCDCPGWPRLKLSFWHFASRIPADR